MATRCVRRVIMAVGLIGALSVSAAWPVPDDDPAASITTAELRDHIFFLASDELEGRDTGSPGYDIAAAYAMTQLRSAGLMPVFAGPDGKPSYKQRVPMISYLVGKGSALTVRADAGELNFFHLGEMVLFQNASARPENLTERDLVFLGYGIDDGEAGWSDYKGLDVKGKAVLVMPGTPRRDGRPVFTPEKENFYRGFGNSVNAKVRWAAARGAAAVILVPNPEIAADWKGNILERIIRRQYNFAAESGASANSQEIYFLHPAAAAEILKMAGVSFADGDSDYTASVLKGLEVRGTVVKDDAREVTGWNIAALLPGTDPVLKDEIIVLHAHLDHLGLRGDGVPRNGADDNASGCAVLLEAAEALAMKPAKRSVIFALFTAEERGLLGSEWFIEHPPLPLEKIVLDATADMIGRHSEGKSDAIFVTAGGAGQERLYEAVSRAEETGFRAGIEILKDNTDLGGCDTHSFLRRGISSLLFTRGFLPPCYHSPDDDAETLDFGKITRAARLICRTLFDLGNR